MAIELLTTHNLTTMCTSNSGNINASSSKQCYYCTASTIASPSLHQFLVDIFDPHHQTSLLDFEVTIFICTVNYYTTNSCMHLKPIFHYRIQYLVYQKFFLQVSLGLLSSSRICGGILETSKWMY